MSFSLPRIAVLTTSEPLIRREDVDEYSDLNRLLAAEPYDVLLLDQPASQAAESLRRLRQLPNYRFSLICCCRDQDAWCQALGDGAPPADLGALPALWHLWQERMGLFNRGNAPDRYEARVMAWLWLHSPRDIHAVRDPQSPQHYSYPLLETMAEDEQSNSFAWLQLMTQQGWLEQGSLVDRLRLCASCGSGRLNYVDVCVECRSLDISRQPSLHCFTCGHVGPQEHFLKDGLLLCPNCLTRLRHIGSDYDRPLENYRCRDCQAFFVDAEVEARCLDCGQSHSPDRLRIREVRHYRLTEAGRLRCRQGLSQSQDQVDHFGQMNLLSNRAFRELLDWQIEVVRRDGMPTFSLLGLRCANLTEALARVGEQRGHALLDGLVERLQVALREGDRCTRSSEDRLWLLLPNTTEEGLASLRERLARAAELLRAPNVRDIELRMIGFTAPEDMLEQEDSELLLARLSGELV